MWNVSYLVKILEPHQHYVQVNLTLALASKELRLPDSLEIFIPAWSPGSYLMREYARHLRCLKVTDQLGAELMTDVKAKSSWIIDLRSGNEKRSVEKIIISCEVYCHEVSVRTSYIDAQHAFLHGPTYLMGVNGQIGHTLIEFHVPPAWSKISTSLNADSSASREKFLYLPKNYDELLDCPVEMGCHETDGFIVGNVQYELAVFGETFPHKNILKRDIEKIVKVINAFMGEVPFHHYVFIIHFLSQTYGGLEHANSTVLMFDGRKLAIKKDYQSFLSLVAHEYFHAWNVKRIRPRELGPFDYQLEAYTKMLWLAEGLTKFMDDFFVLQAGLMEFSDYVDLVRSDMNSYYKTAGRKYDTLEHSSYGAWIKLYRPHENLHNTTISYYLKGGLVFLCLYLELRKSSISIRDVIAALWKTYSKRPEIGLSKDEFMQSLKGSGISEEILDVFDDYLVTTKEINFLKHFEGSGLEIVFEKPKQGLGLEIEYRGEQLFIKSIYEDGAAHQYGLNAQDEILCVNGQRLMRADWGWFCEQLQEDTKYSFLVSRLGRIQNIDVHCAPSLLQVSALKIVDSKQCEKTFILP